MAEALARNSSDGMPVTVVYSDRDFAMRMTETSYPFRRRQTAASRPWPAGHTFERAGLGDTGARPWASGLAVSSSGCNPSQKGWVCKGQGRAGEPGPGRRIPSPNWAVTGPACPGPAAGRGSPACGFRARRRRPRAGPGRRRHRGLGTASVCHCVTIPVNWI